MDLEVFLDGRDAADKAGTLWAQDFAVLGDPVFSEVIQPTDAGRPEPGRRVQGRKKVYQEQIPFDLLRVPFSVGNGQFVMNDAVIRGPLLGATFRGKVDFKAKRMHLTGTYIPLSGLNRLLSPVPLFGAILTGPEGEGMFGITYEIMGPTADPQVTVNPLTLVSPGITREITRLIFQTAPDNPQVTPRAEPSVKDKTPPQIRESPPIETRRAGTAATVNEPALTDGWSSTTKDAKGSKK